MIDIGEAKAVIFDCDGTIVDTLPLYAAAWGAGFSRQGHRWSPDWYLARAGASESSLLDQYEAEHAVALDRQSIVDAMRRHFRQHLADLTEFKPIAEIARRHHGHLPMAVASGGSRAIVTASLESAGLAPLFDAVVTIDDVGRPKPAPDLFLEAARRLECEPADCLVFEDTEEGLAAARAAGMRLVDVRIVIQAAARSNDHGS